MKNTIITSVSALVFLVIGLFIGKSNNPIEIQTIVKTNIVEKPVDRIVEKVVEKQVVEYVDKYITNVVEKLVQKEIPVEYAKAYLLIDKQNKPKYLEYNQIPKGVNKIRVKSYVSDSIKNIVSEETLNNIMELELRKIGVSIDKSADYSLTYTIDAFWNDSKSQITYSDEISVSNVALHLSGGEYYFTTANIFLKKHFGFVGKAKADQQLFSAAISESMIEVCNKILESREK